MKIEKLIDIMNSPRNTMLKADQVKSVLAKELEVKKYLSIKDKKALVEEIVNECVLYSDGIFKFNDIDKYICFTMKTIAAYTNIELSVDIEEDYDALCEAGLLNSVIDTFAGEYENVGMLLQMKCDYILSGNSMESQMGRFLDGILDKIEALANVMSEKVENFDMSKLPVSQEDLTKLLGFINK